MLSDNCQQALRDMVEMQLYLLMQPQRKPCPMLPRSTMKFLPGKKAHSNFVESSAVSELMDRGFIEPSSSLTFVVSKSGREYYRSELS